MSWSEIVGQARAIRQIRASLDAGRLPHAYLFAGPRGVGKFRTAVTLVQALFCPEGEGREGCGRCRTCRRLRVEAHPDCLVLRRPEGRQRIPIGTDEKEPGSVRRALAALTWKPLEVGARALIVDEAELLSIEASTALLKTVEEPPPRSLIVLVAAKPRLLSPTLRSRCQTVRFGLLEASEVRRVLEGAVPGKASVDAACAVAEGSPGRAIAIARGEAAFPADRYDALRETSPVSVLDRANLEGGKRKAPSLAAAKRDRVRTLLRFAAEGLRRDPSPSARRGLTEILQHLEALERNVQPDLVLDAARRTLAVRRGRDRRAAPRG